MAAAAASSPSNDSNPTPLYKFKIILNDYPNRPRGGRWRRVIVPANFSLMELHLVIQVVFGWKSYHLHHFLRNRGPQQLNDEIFTIIDEIRKYNLTPEMVDERFYELSDVFSEEKTKMQYEYDFGMCWEHEIKFEGVVEADPNLDYPACVQGKWSNRVEDGNDADDGYGYLLPGFEAQEFDLQETQQRLQTVFAGKWPLKFDNTTLPKCYLCAYYHCRVCNGKCCNFCLKTDIHWLREVVERLCETGRRQRRA